MVYSRSLQTTKESEEGEEKERRKKEKCQRAREREKRGKNSPSLFVLSDVAMTLMLPEV